MKVPIQLCCKRSSPPMSLMGHSRPMHSVPVPINVRCYSNSDIIVRRSAVTLRASNRLMHCNKIRRLQTSSRRRLVFTSKSAAQFQPRLRLRCTSDAGSGGPRAG
jgi:hypothetical protein